MRVILLTHGGADLVIEHIASIDGVELVEVFIETRTTSERGFVEKLKRSLKYDGVAVSAKKALKLTSRSQTNSNGKATDLTRQRAESLGLRVTEVDDFHSAESIEKMRNSVPDLGVIFGTNIIKESVFSIPKLGSINLHQGKAPFYRGGPPVFWELFNDEKEIGLTVHFVAAKVDTGDIVLQRTVPLKYDPSFGLDFDSFIDDLRSGIRADSADLLAEAVRRISTGDFERTAQDTSLGKRYRLPTKKEKDELRRRLRDRLDRGANE